MLTLYAWRFGKVLRVVVLLYSKFNMVCLNVGDCTAMKPELLERLMNAITELYQEHGWNSETGAWKQWPVDDRHKTEPGTLCIATYWYGPHFLDTPDGRYHISLGSPPIGTCSEDTFYHLTEKFGLVHVRQYGRNGERWNVWKITSPLWRRLQ